MGIDETLKLIDVIENGGLQLLTVDFEKVSEELKELDWKENKELGLRLLELIMSVIGSLSMAKSPIVSFAVPLGARIIKGLAS
jgi:hypothetical protein